MAEPDDIVELADLVEQWGQEFALERELAGLAAAVGDDTWVTLADAERQGGVSRSTLRTWYRTGQIASRLMPGPHGLQRLVPLEVVLEKAANSPRTGPRPARPTEEEPEMATAAAMVRLAELATTAATERAEVAEARAAAVESALHAALERAAAAEAELRLLRRAD